MSKIKIIFRILQKQKHKIMSAKDYLILQILALLKNKTSKQKYFYCKELSTLDLSQLIKLKKHLYHDA